MNYVFGNIQNKFERKVFAKSHITDRKSLTSWQLPTSANHSLFTTPSFHNVSSGHMKIHPIIDPNIENFLKAQHPGHTMFGNFERIAYKNNRPFEFFKRLEWQSEHLAANGILVVILV